MGAILDSRYELELDTYFLEPWYFADEIPVLFSEIIFKIPREVVAVRWSRDPLRIGLKTETETNSRGTELRAWAENLPSVPDDPYGPPFGDLALKMMMVPQSYSGPYLYARMLESWEAICKAVEEEAYAKARRKDGGVTAQAKSVAGSAGSARAKAEAIYRFVRDEVATEDEPGILPEEGSSLQKVLAERRGNSAEKALLLDGMFEAVGVDARLAWAGDRSRGQIDLKLPNPGWFDRALVMALIDGQLIALDPSDRALPFGKLQYGYEGTPALVHDPIRPRQVILPETPFEQNVKRAVLDLALDAEGRLAGTGELVLTGHPAWERIDWKEDEERTLAAWKEWLGDHYRGFDVAGVQFQELRDEWKVRLTWSLRQRDEDVLGDEVSLVPSRPLGPITQTFIQPADKRRSPVLFPYGDVEEVELRLRWPEGWKIESVPGLTKQEFPVGALAVEVAVKDAERVLVYRRHFEMRFRQLGSSQDYEAARALFAAVEKSDAQTLALVRR